MIERFDGEYRFLSNFYSIPICYEGTVYPSVEAAFQAAKTCDPEQRIPFTRYAPGLAKKEGRRLALRPDWERVKVGIMTKLVRRKFLDAGLRERLLATGDQELVEGNWWHDIYWGRCNGVGENYLGRILMLVRDEMRSKVMDGGAIL